MCAGPEGEASSAEGPRSPCHHWEAQAITSPHIGSEGVSDGFGRVEAAEPQRTVGTHQDRLRGRTAVAAI